MSEEISRRERADEVARTSSIRLSHSIQHSYSSTHHLTGDEGITHHWRELLQWMAKGSHAEHFKAECHRLDANMDGLLHCDLVNAAFEKAGYVEHSIEKLRQIYHAL